MSEYLPASGFPDTFVGKLKATVAPAAPAPAAGGFIANLFGGLRAAPAGPTLFMQGSGGGKGSLIGSGAAASGASSGSGSGFATMRSGLPGWALPAGAVVLVGAIAFLVLRKKKKRRS